MRYCSPVVGVGDLVKDSRIGEGVHSYAAELRYYGLHLAVDIIAGGVGGVESDQGKPTLSEQRKMVLPHLQSHKDDQQSD